MKQSISIADTNLKNCGNHVYPVLQFCDHCIKGKIGDYVFIDAGTPRIK
jgi:uncharacterized OB-fold protein